MRAFIAFLCCLLVGLPAQAGGNSLMFKPGIRGAWGGLSISAICAYGSTYADGCAGANTSSTFKVVTAYGVPFNTYATSSSYLGSSQTWINAHLQPWNVAGVDYPVGYYTALGSLLNPHTNIPAGCGYIAAGVGNGYMGGGAVIRCNLSGSNSLDIEGYDFGSENGIQLYISGTTTGTVTIKNNRFACGAPLCSATPSGALLQFASGSGASAFYVGFNSFDGGDGPNSTNCSGGRCTFGGTRSIQAYNTLGSRTFEYNYFGYTTARPVSGNGMSANSVIFRYNYFEGITGQDNPGEHAEIYIESNPSAAILPLMDYLFNTVVISRLSPYNLGTSLIELTTGGASVTWTQIDVIGNTLISNGTPSLQNTFSTIIEAANTIGTLNTYSNYIDPTYILANHCFVYYGTITSPNVGSGGVPNSGGTQNANLVTGGIINATWPTGTVSGTSNC